MKQLALVALMLAVGSTTSFSDPAPGPPPSASAASQDSAPPPFKGRPHTCNQWYPKDAQRAGIEGTTLLAFHIAAEGYVTHITIAQSSGSKELDYAAYLCARPWHYLPATQNGKPIEIPWTAKVIWQIPAMAAPTPDSGDQKAVPTP